VSRVTAREKKKESNLGRESDRKKTKTDERKGKEKVSFALLPLPGKEKSLSSLATHKDKKRKGCAFVE